MNGEAPSFFSEKYDDIYFSHDDPEAEKQFVFVEANRISQRIRQSETFTVAELGFGFGLNYALTRQAAKQADCLHKLRYFSVEEKFPEEAQVKALAEKLKICRSEFFEIWPSPPSPLSFRRGAGGEVQHTDVLTFLNEAKFQADAWYFDGFSPAKNPAMWSSEVFELAFRLTKPGGTFSTYSAAGWVKRNLSAAGFVVEKVPGFGSKREMLKGYRPPALPPRAFVAERGSGVKRAAEYLKIWRESFALLKPEAHIAILGGGISGLHLAEALHRHGHRITVYDPHRNGGVRIPLVHACHTLKARAPLWEQAAIYSRIYYRAQAGHPDVVEKTNPMGVYFNIRLRPYLRRLKRHLAGKGVVFVKRKAEPGAAELAAFDLTFIATGSESRRLIQGRTIPGWESYFSRFAHPAASADIGKNGDKITNYIHIPPRAGFIHRNDETAAAAATFAREIHPTGRHALFYGERFTTRDRFPVIGLNNGAFCFFGMGYHAMTYAPFLAHAVAEQLSGIAHPDENLVCTLTPARFLP